MIKLVLTDLDDTLIPFGDPGVSDFARAAIHELLDAGVHFGPVSGRPPRSMSWMFGNDPACFATGAFSNGQVVYVDGRLCHTASIPRDVIERAVAAIDEMDGALIALIDLDDDSKGAFVTLRPEGIDKVPQTFPYAKTARVGLGEGPFVKGCIFFTRDDQDYVTEVREKLKALVPELDFFRPSNVICALDYTPADWSKGAAVLAIARELGIRADEVCVFGDSENDVAMFDAVPYSVAVANACPEAKAAARFEIGDCREESVAKALLEIAAASLGGELPAFLRQPSS